MLKVCDNIEILKSHYSTYMFGYFIVRIFSKLKDNLGESIVIKLFTKLKLTKNIGIAISKQNLRASSIFPQKSHGR